MADTSLLRWGIENSDLDALRASAEDADAQPKRWDPELVEYILGKDDAVRIREETAVFVDAQRPAEDRLAAWENLEMLVEQIDNAVNVDRMSLWPGIFGVLGEADARVVRCAYSLVGTAAQNNPEVQRVLASMGALETAHACVADSSAALDVRCKAMRAVSALVQHCPANFERYSAIGGFAGLDRVVAGGAEQALRDRIVFCAASLSPAPDGDGTDCEMDVELDLSPYPSLSAAVAAFRSA